MENVAMPESENTPRHLWALALVMALGAGFRFLFIGKESLWFDEGLSVWFAQRPLVELWGQVPGYETHPPLYYTLLKVWISIFGDGESAVRALSALAGLFTIPLVYAMGRIVVGGKRGVATGLTAAALFALAPVQVLYAQEARPYAFLVFSSTLAICGALWLLANPAQARLPYFGFRGAHLPYGWQVKWAWLSLIIGTALSLWFHNMGALLAASLVLVVLPLIAMGPGGAGGLLKNAALAGAAIILFWFPFMPWFLRQSGNVRGSFWLAQGPHWISNGLEYIFLFLFPGRMFMALVLALAAAGIYTVTKDRGINMALALLGLLVLPLAMVIGVSWLVKPMFLARTLLWVSVPFYVLAGAGLAMTPDWRLKAVLSLALAGGLLYGENSYYMSYKKEPWREITNNILAQAADEDEVLLLPNGAGLLFSYYQRGLRPKLRTFALPQPFPALGLDRQYPTGNMAQPALDAKDAQWLESFSCQTHDIWVVMRLPGLFDPGSMIVNTLSASCRLQAAGAHSVLHYMRFSAKEAVDGGVPKGD